MKNKLQFALIPFFLLTTAAAHAEEASSEKAASVATPYAQTHDFRLDVSTGAFESPSSDGGLTLGASALRRTGLLEYGLDTTFGNQVFGYSFGEVDAAGGLGWQTRSGLRLEALAEFGGTYYNGVGKELLSSNPGVNGIAPSVRAKAGVSYVFSPAARDHFVVGLWFYGDDDLTRESKTITFEQQNLLGGSEGASERETIGTSRLGAMISLGGVLPF